MPVAQLTDSNQLNNHDLNKLVEKTTEILKLSALQAINSTMNPGVYKLKPKNIKVGGKKIKEYPSIAKVVTDRFSKLPKDVKKASGIDLGRDYSLTKSIHDWSVNIRSSKPITEQIDIKKHFDFINDKTFSDTAMQEMVENFSQTHESITPIDVEKIVKHELSVIDSKFSRLLPSDWINKIDIGTPSTIIINKGIKFRMHEVKCVDETNPEWPGHDEIAYGGAVVDDKDNATKIDEKYVGGGFDDGDKKTYSPPEIIADFQLDDNTFPKTFLVSLALAEKDSNGLSEFIKELYEAIKAEVQVIMTALGAAAGAAIGTAIGGSIGTAIAGPLGTIIGTAAGAIIGALVGWLISALKDDIFPPQASSITLNSTDDTFAGGSLISPIMYLHYRDHGGHYRIKYDWQIIR